MTSTKLVHSSWESDHPQWHIFTLKMQGGLHQWPFLETRRMRLSNAGFSHSEKVFWSQLIKGLANPKATNLTRFLIQQRLWLGEELGFCFVWWGIYAALSTVCKSPWILGLCSLSLWHHTHPWAHRSPLTVHSCQEVEICKNTAEIFTWPSYWSC